MKDTVFATKVFRPDDLCGRFNCVFDDMITQLPTLVEVNGVMRNQLTLQPEDVGNTRPAAKVSEFQLFFAQSSPTMLLTSCLVFVSVLGSCPLFFLWADAGRPRDPRTGP